MTKILFPQVPTLTFEYLQRERPELYPSLLDIVGEMVELTMTYGNSDADAEIVKRNLIRGIDAGIFAFGVNYYGNLVLLTWNYTKGAYLEFTANNFNRQETAWTLGMAQYMFNVN